MVFRMGEVKYEIDFQVVKRMVEINKPALGWEKSRMVEINKLVFRLGEVKEEINKLVFRLGEVKDGGDL